MPDPISLLPGESATVGHAVAGSDANLIVGESVTVTAIEPEPPEPPPPPPIVLTLVEPLADKEVGPITDGQKILMPYAIEAEPAFPTGSVRFYANGSQLRIENNAPFAAWGDKNGDYAPSTFGPGMLDLVVQAYAGPNATGQLLSEREVELEIGQLPPPVEPPPPTDPGGPFPNKVLEVLTPKAIASLKLPAGWVERGADFFQTSIELGKWGWQGTTTAFPRWTRGDAVWRIRNPSYLDSSQRGRYATPENTYQGNGELVSRVGGMTKDGQKRSFACPMPIWGAEASHPTMETIDRSYAFRMELLAKFPTITNGGKVAYLGWGDARINQVGYYEIDMPEHKFGGGLRCNAFKHHADTVGGQESRELKIDTGQFHLFTIEHFAKGYRGHATGYDVFSVDGEERLRSTNHISTRDLYLALQSETYLKHDPVLPPAAWGDIVWRMFRISEPA